MNLTKIINSSFILIEKINVYGILKIILIEYNKKKSEIKKRNYIEGLSKNKTNNINSLLKKGFEITNRIHNLTKIRIWGTLLKL